MTKYIEKLEEIKRNYRYKKDELFKRLKVTTFAQLALQVASVSDELQEMTDEELRRLEDSNSVVSDTDPELLTVRTNGKGSPEEAPSSPIQFIDNNNLGAGESINTSRSTLQSVISGVGELDLGRSTKGKTDSETNQSPRTLDKPYADCPFLLLDVRDRDAYEQCHLIGAHNYPIAMLSRTMNPYSNEILEFKNAHGKIIILYDEDERISSQAATTMCERGFENVFMLSGGLKVIAQKFPEGLNTGSFPTSCLPPPPPQVTSARKRPTPRPPASPAENKWRFSTGDLQKIEQQLEQMLMPSDSASRLSRLSSGRQDSKASNLWTNQSPSSASSMSARSLVSTGLPTKPWK
ncbi:centrosomal protein of 41 kDa isoform X2 [Ambystoma mexicanum]